MLLDRRGNCYALGYDKGHWVYRDRDRTTPVLHARGVMLRPTEGRSGWPGGRRRGRRLQNLGNARIMAHDYGWFCTEVECSKELVRTMSLPP